MNAGLCTLEEQGNFLVTGDLNGTSIVRNRVDLELGKVQNIVSFADYRFWKATRHHIYALPFFCVTLISVPLGSGHHRRHIQSQSSATIALVRVRLRTTSAHRTVVKVNMRHASSPTRSGRAALLHRLEWKPGGCQVHGQDLLPQYFRRQPTSWRVAQASGE